MKNFLFAVILTIFFITPAYAEKAMRNIAYGLEKLETMDIYLPENISDAPVILMVHGGGWSRGDKAMDRVVENKKNRWLPLGFVFISINYPMLPEADVKTQSIEVAKALAFAQQKAASFKGNSDKFILMGHSAGAHLVSLLNSNPETAYKYGARKWLGSVSLDSAGLDIPKVMQSRHFGLYDEAFGHYSEAQLEEVSPWHQLTAKALPWLGVCSSRRATSCDQAHQYESKAKGLGTETAVIEQDLSHEEINETLGLSSEYTARVETFMASLDGDVARRLSQAPKTATVKSEAKAENNEDHPMLKKWLARRASGQ